MGAALAASMSSILQLFGKVLPDPQVAAEAQSGSLFIGGWRPAVGWVCVLGLAYQFLAFPMLAWAGANLA